jgi:TRAP-type C4-dicarboxylate transport system substrate-binding protein
LQSGVIDAQENMTSNIWGRNLHEVQKYLIETRHSIFPIHINVSQKRWESFSKKQQEIIQKAAAEAEKHANPTAGEQLVSDIKRCKDNGMIHLKVDIGEFRKAAKPAVDQLLGEMAPGVKEAVQWATGK